jgi:hypothetical protein
MPNDLLGQRAEALATMFLTRQPGVAVERAPGNLYDLQVDILDRGKHSGILFGIELKSRDRLSKAGSLVEPGRLRLAADVRRQLTKNQAGVNNLPFPLLFIVFAMDTDRGFHGWLRAPAARRSLRTPTPEFAEEWGPSTHSKIVDCVKQWYRGLGGN